MATPHQPSLMALLVIVPLLAWRIWARTRRMVGRQRFTKVRGWIQLTIFPLLLVLLALATFTHPERLLLLAAGVTGGVLLGRYGLRKTKFEPTPQGLYYTPNAHLGVALSVLFIGRILYRLVEVFYLDADSANHMQDFGRSPLTLGVFGLLAGYYISYAIGLVRWRSGVLRRKREREAAAAAVPPDGA